MKPGRPFSSDGRPAAPGQSPPHDYNDAARDQGRHFLPQKKRTGQNRHGELRGSENRHQAARTTPCDFFGGCERFRPAPSRGFGTLARVLPGRGSYGTRGYLRFERKTVRKPKSRTRPPEICLGPNSPTQSRQNARKNPLKTGTETGVAQHRRGAPRGIIPPTTPSPKVNDQAKRKARP